MTPASLTMMARLMKTNWAQVLLVGYQVNPYVGFEMATTG
ncbi:Uncharacterised protein [Salmonella enterica subsp. enterica]|uniref:Uncharacterized protein n=1 Tax=Salmonella enterica I TaxID=59201 RepID=A0A379WWG7_SALET|nr:Uncharacterised protein [Salmonella enterica subsp. enterica]